MLLQTAKAQINAKGYYTLASHLTKHALHHLEVVTIKMHLLGEITVQNYEKHDAYFISHKTTYALLICIINQLEDECKTRPNWKPHTQTSNITS